MKSQFELIGNNLTKNTDHGPTYCALKIAIADHWKCICVFANKYLHICTQTSVPLSVWIPSSGLSRALEHPWMALLAGAGTELQTFELPELELPRPELSWDDELSRTDLKPA